jgi:hypothetical protein
MPAMVSKHSQLVNRLARDRYGRFSSSSSRTAPPSSRQEVGSSSHRHTAPPSSRQELGSSSRRRTAPPPSSDDSSVKMWEVPPPPLTRLDNSSLTSSGYNDEYHHIKEMSSYELFLDFNCLI